MPQTNYLTRAWADLTREKGWYKSLILLGLAACVPLIGPVIVTGYLLDWGKEASWGMDRGLPRRVGSVGRRLRYGLIALVIFAAWLLPILVADALLSMVPGMGMLLHFVCLVAELVFFALALVAVLRGLVYERIGPGLQFVRIFKMAGHDTAHLAWAFAISAVAWIVGLLINALFDLVYAPVGAMLAAGATSTVQSLSLLLGIGLVSTIIAFVAYCVGVFAITVLMAIAIRSYGYWLAQFEPAKWGTPKDEMPFENEYVQAVEQARPIDPQAEPQPADEGEAAMASEGVQAPTGDAPAPDAQVEQPAPAPDAPAQDMANEAGEAPAAETPAQAEAAQQADSAPAPEAPDAAETPDAPEAPDAPDAVETLDAPTPDKEN